MTTTSLELDGPDAFTVPAIWLRDSCGCNECRDAHSGQRLRSILSLDPSTSISQLDIDGDDITVVFAPDGHVSRYSREWLAANAPGRTAVFDDRSEGARSPWLAADLGGEPPQVTWAALASPGDARRDALGALLDLGLLLVRDVPRQPGQVLEVARSFGFVRSTNYGDLFDVRVEANPVNLAFTGRAILPHTDNPYREPVPGIQLLHCLASSAAGGENVFIDGFAAAARLRRDNAAAFATLATTPLTFRYDDATTALRASGTTIECNRQGEVRSIRWNDRSVEPPQVAADRVDDLYAALRAFAEVLKDPALHLHLVLAPGDCIVFDNTRVLHARTAFSESGGTRHLQGCYADLDALASAVAIESRTATSNITTIRSSAHRSIDDAIDAIEQAFASAEGMAYLGEDVTMIQHQLQAGELARVAGADDALVVAALLHDVGHMVGPAMGERDAATAIAAELDAHHDASGARWLSQWFSLDVTEPVRLHVAAKRYLVAAEPDYAAKLSPASVHTLQLQGGPMTPDEAIAFGSLVHAAAAVAVRRFDEAAKDPTVEAPPISAHRTLLARVLRATDRAR